MKVSSKRNLNGYRCEIEKVKCGVSLFVTSCVGSMNAKVKSQAEKIDTLIIRCESDPSNKLILSELSLSSFSSILRVENINEKSIELGWDNEDEEEENEEENYFITYKILRNDKTFKSDLPSTSKSATIHDFKIGETIVLQLQTNLKTQPPHQRSLSRSSSISRPNSVISDQENLKKILSNKIKIKISNLIRGVSQLVVIETTGHSAILEWSLEDIPKASYFASSPFSHFRNPDYFQISWGRRGFSKKTDHLDKTTNDYQMTHVNSLITEENKCRLENLTPDSSYWARVEARATSHYIQIDKVTNQEKKMQFIMRKKSDHVIFNTSSYPQEDLLRINLISSTPSSIYICWNKLGEENDLEEEESRGRKRKTYKKLNAEDLKVLGYRVEIKEVITKKRKLSSSDSDEMSGQSESEEKNGENILKIIEVTKNKNKTEIKNLKENTKYIVVVTAVTKQYFDHIDNKNKKNNNKINTIRTFPQNEVTPRSRWLPRSVLTCSTSGTEPPHSLRIISSSMGNVTLGWEKPTCKGSNTFQETIVKWVKVIPEVNKKKKKFNHDDSGDIEKEEEKEEERSYKEIGKEKSERVFEKQRITLWDLTPGHYYKIQVVALISEKIKNIEKKKDKKKSFINGEIESYISNHKTKEYKSQPIIFRSKVLAPPPLLFITGFTNETCNLTWQNPELLAITNKKRYGNTEEDEEEEEEDDEDDKSSSDESQSLKNTRKYIKLHLVGYKLTVNGKAHTRLSSASTNFTLIHCKFSPQKYFISLSLATCPLSVFKIRKKMNLLNTWTVFDEEEPKFEDWIEKRTDEDWDFSESKEVMVELPPQDIGCLSYNEIKFVYPKSSFEFSSSNLSNNKSRSLSSYGNRVKIKKNKISDGYESDEKVTNTNKKKKPIGFAKIKWNVIPNKKKKIKFFEVFFKKFKMRNNVFFSKTKYDDDDDSENREEEFEKSKLITKPTTNRLLLPLHQPRLIVDVLVQPIFESDDEDSDVDDGNEEKNISSSDKDSDNREIIKNEIEQEILDENKKHKVKNKKSKENKKIETKNSEIDKKNKINKNKQHLQLLTPGPPNKPTLWLTAISRNTFSVQWTEPVLYNCKVKGYQLYINGQKENILMNHTIRRSTIKFSSNKTYNISVRAIGEKEFSKQSEESNVVEINPERELKKIKFNKKLRQTKSKARNMKYNIKSDEDDSFYLNEKKNYEEEDEEDEEGVELKVSKKNQTSVYLEWNYKNKSNLSDNSLYKILWSSANNEEEKIKNKKKIRKVLLPLSEKNCTLQNCIPGIEYLVRVLVLNEKEKIISKSATKSFFTQPLLFPPSIFLKTINFNHVTIGWKKNKEGRDEEVETYKVYVNGVVSGRVSREVEEFTLSGGEWCLDYVFQVQAISGSSLSSSLSQPLTITWPGVIPPYIFWNNNNKNDNNNINKSEIIELKGLVICGNIKIKKCLLIITEEESKKTFNTIELDPEELMREEKERGDTRGEGKSMVQIKGLKSGFKYSAYLQIYIYGTNKIFLSNEILIEPFSLMSSPEIKVEILGLKERKSLERDLKILINYKDNLLLENDFSKNEVRRVEGLINSCLQTLHKQFTGEFEVKVTWSEISLESLDFKGCHVIVDGKIYNGLIDKGEEEATLKLAATTSKYVISLITVNHNNSYYDNNFYNTSSNLHYNNNFLPSNFVEVSCSFFFPFSYFCFFSQKPKDSSEFLNLTSFKTSFNIEKKSRSKIHLGLLEKPFLVSSSIKSTEVATGDSKGVLKDGLNLLFFWSSWSSCCHDYLKWLKTFCENNCSFIDYNQLNISTISCESRGSSSTRDHILKILQATGLSFFPSSCLNHFLNYLDYEAHDPLVNLFQVPGVPFFLFVQNGSVLWKGRFCCLSYQDFDNFIQHVINKTNNIKSINNDFKNNNNFYLENFSFDLAELENRYPKKPNKVFTNNHILSNINNDVNKHHLISNNKSKNTKSSNSAENFKIFSNNSSNFITNNNNNSNYSENQEKIENINIPHNNNNNYDNKNFNNNNSNNSYDDININNNNNNNYDDKNINNNNDNNNNYDIENFNNNTNNNNYDDKNFKNKINNSEIVRPKTSKTKRKAKNTY